MTKSLFSFLAVVAMLFTLASCQSANDEVREAAKQTIEPATTAPNTAAAAPSTAAPAGPVTTIEFADGGTFDFGTVDAGEIVTHTFSFTNTGDNPLIVSDAKGSCGCTVPSKPTAPIQPGETGEITVQFNSANKEGKRNQKVTLTANTTPAQSFLYLTGNVTPDPNKQQQEVTQ